MIFAEKELKEYLVRGDIVSKLMDSTGEAFASHRWLADSLPKRAIYDSLYGDFLQPGESKRILDIGGGFCSLSKILIDHHDYTLLDIMAHDDASNLGDFLIQKDWFEFEPDSYDIVIANDLFPNVDQRLELFLEKYLPITKEMRMSLTYYNVPRFYTTKRINADEIFCQLAYNGRQVKDILERFFECSFEELLLDLPSLFSNDRQISILKEST